MNSPTNDYTDIPSITLQRIRDEINDELGRRTEAALKRHAKTIEREYQQQQTSTEETK